MKKFSFVLVVLALALALGLAFVSCGDDSGPTGGGGNTLEGNGVVWEINEAPGGQGLVFRDGTAYAAVLSGDTWITSTTGRVYTYTATHLLAYGYSFSYSISGNTLIIEGTAAYTRRTGQKIQFYG